MAGIFRKELLLFIISSSIFNIFQNFKKGTKITLFLIKKFIFLIKFYYRKFLAGGTFLVAIKCKKNLVSENIAPNVGGDLGRSESLFPPK